MNKKSLLALVGSILLPFSSASAKVGGGPDHRNKPNLNDVPAGPLGEPGDGMTAEERAEEAAMQAEDQELKEAGIQEVAAEEQAMLGFLTKKLPDDIETAYINFYRMVDRADAGINGREDLKLDPKFAERAMFLTEIYKRFSHCQPENGLDHYYGKLTVPKFDADAEPCVREAAGKMKAKLVDIRKDGQVSFKEAVEYEMTTLPIYAGNLGLPAWEKLSVPVQDAAVMMMSWNGLEPYEDDGFTPTDALHKFAVWLDAKASYGPMLDPLGKTKLPLIAFDKGVAPQELELE